MLKRFEIQVLRRAGHTHSQIADLTGVSADTVRRVEREQPIAAVDDVAERLVRRIGRPCKARRFQDYVRKVLADEPGLMSLEILRRARLKGYEGGKSAMYELVASLRTKPGRLLVRFEGLPGEFAQHDFGQIILRFLSGETRRTHFFASRLKFSRWAQVTLVRDEAVESLVRSLVEHYGAFGGVPLVSVFDRPKTVALQWKRDGTVTEWNQVFAHVMLELGVGVEVCWPGRGQEKGAVENLVGWVKGSFFKQRRFLDEADLAQQLADWHAEVNTRIPSRATGLTPLQRIAEERARLRPLKLTADTLALRLPVFVGPTGFVLHDTHRYSMDPEAIGMPATLHLYRDRVRILAGRFEATHPRLITPGANSILPAHFPRRVAAVSGKRGKRYLMRQHLLDVGDVAHTFLTEIIHRRPGQWIRDVERLHALLEQHGADSLRNAFSQALSAGTFGSEYVAHSLETLRRGEPAPSPAPRPADGDGVAPLLPLSGLSPAGGVTAFSAGANRARRAR